MDSLFDFSTLVLIKTISQVKVQSYHVQKREKKNFMAPFLWMGFNCLKATATSRRQFTFYHSVPRNSWYSFYRPRKDERLSQLWSHPVVLNTGPLDWESRALTTRPRSVDTPAQNELLCQTPR